MAKRITELAELTPRMIEALLGARVETVEMAHALGPVTLTHMLQHGKPALSARELDHVLRVLSRP